MVIADYDELVDFSEDPTEGVLHLGCSCEKLAGG